MLKALDVVGGAVEDFPTRKKGVEGHHGDLRQQQTLLLHWPLARDAWSRRHNIKVPTNTRQQHVENMISFSMS